MKAYFENEMHEKLYYELENNNSKVLAIMVPGFKSDKDMPLFKKIGEDLSVDYLRIDFSGCGESDGNYSHSTIKKQVNELCLFIKKMNYEKIILIGHSMGCTVSIIASQFSKKIASLILINPLVFPYLTFNDSLIKFSPYVVLRKFNPENNTIYDRFKKLKETKEKIITKIKKEVMGREMFEEMKTLDVMCIAKKINLPVFIIHGRKDELIPLSHAQYINFNVKNSQLAILNYFHSPFAENEINEVSKQTLSFIKILKEKFLK
ncbi:MAG: alpha/beta hydrolase [Candidatus Nanoarchaeia archaeon]|nr:alpha/beta hydrolase [Candidatus Nanoarchaeia archaeon]